MHSPGSVARTVSALAVRSRDTSSTRIRISPSPGFSSASSQAWIRPMRCSTPTNFPGAASVGPDQRAGALRIPDRARHGDHGERRPQWRRTERTNTSDAQLTTSICRSGASFAQDQWRVTQALTVNAGLRYQAQLAVTPGISSYFKADCRRTLRRVWTGEWRRSGDARVQHVHARRADRAAIPQYVQFEPGATAVCGGPQQPRAEHRRRLAPAGEGRLLANPAGRSGTGHDP